MVHTICTASQAPMPILWLLQNNIYSDVEVLVGPGGAQFNLHRNILASRSEFFSKALKDCFREGALQRVLLPTILPEVWMPILKWIYGGGFEIRDEAEKITEIYEAADFLQIPNFRNWFIKALTEQIGLDFKPSNKNPRVIDDPYMLLARLFALTPAPNSRLLQSLTDKIIQVCPMPIERLHKLMYEERQDIDISALLLSTSTTFERYPSAWCIKCRAEFKLADPSRERCIKCNTFL